MSKSMFITVIAVIVATVSIALAVAGTAIQGVFAGAVAQVAVWKEAYEGLITTAPFLADVLPAVGGFVGLLLGAWLLWMLVCPAFRR